MRIEMSSGNFNFTVSGELSAEKQDELLKKGMKYELERGVLTKTYTALAGVTGKRGKLVLPEGFERESIVYDDANAVEFATAMQATLDKLGSFKVTVSEYVKGESGDSRKRATGIYAQSAEKGEATLERLAMICGYDGDHEDEREFVEAIHEWLLSTTK